MIGHYQRKWSPSALWSQRLALLSIPYFAIAILLHRFDAISAPQVFWLIGVGLVIVMISLLLGLRGLVQVWNRGWRGGGQAFRGVLLSTVALAPFAWFAYLGVTRPAISDATTDPVRPPEFMLARDLRQTMVPQGANRLANYDVAYGQLLIESYPQLTSRRYNTGAERVYGVVRTMIEERGWRVTAVRGIGIPAATGGDKTEPEGDEAPQAAEDGVLAGGNVGVVPPEDISVEAVTRSLIFGLRQDIVVEIVSEAESTLVNMRASTRWGAHDFGRNAETITKFLADLDTALIGIAGEG
jgi:Protein of unknown function (DUF1499)